MILPGAHLPRRYLCTQGPSCETVA
jgi:hypothetical protein